MDDVSPVDGTDDEGPEGSEVAVIELERLFVEPGATWWWVLAGPAAALAMIGIQAWSGAGVEWTVPLAFLVLVSGFVALQIKAARMHTSVELTREWLRQGQQTISVDEILLVYPAPVNGGRRHYDGRLFKANKSFNNNALTNRALRQAGIDETTDPEPEPEADKNAAIDRAIVEKWQASRALGELTGVPRGRTGIGLKLVGGRTAQAWARNHGGLRAALTPLVAERTNPGSVQ